MNCPNCGTVNEENYKFCIKCGYSNPKIIPKEVDDSAPIANNLYQNTFVTNVVNQNVTSNTALNNENIIYNKAVDTANNTIVKKITELSYFRCIIGMFCKPKYTYEEQKEYLQDRKKVLTYVGIIAGLMLVLNLIAVIITSMRTATLSFETVIGYTWDIANITQIKYLNIIGRDIILYSLLMFGGAGVFYIGGLLIKKQFNYFNLLCIVALSVIPLAVCTIFVAPIVGLIWYPFQSIIAIGGIIYSAIILYELINSELKIEGDKKVYFNLACIGITVSIAYLCYIKFFLGFDISTYISLFT